MKSENIQAELITGYCDVNKKCCTKHDITSRKRVSVAMNASVPLVVYTIFRIPVNIVLKK